LYPGEKILLAVLAAPPVGEFPLTNLTGPTANPKKL
jgi:hypothetical protein